MKLIKKPFLIKIDWIDAASGFYIETYECHILMDEDETIFRNHDLIKELDVGTHILSNIYVKNTYTTRDGIVHCCTCKGVRDLLKEL